MTKDPLVYIDHILESIKAIENYTKDTEKKQFLLSVQLQDSVIRRIEIIGEAVKSIPIVIKDKYREIPWKSIAGMRDKIVHEYFSIDLELTWVVVEKEIPKLKRRILKLKKDLSK